MVILPTILRDIHGIVHEISMGYDWVCLKVGYTTKISIFVRKMMKFTNGLRGNFQRTYVD